jgi:hypothetical protein
MMPLREAVEFAMRGGLEATAIKDVLAIYGSVFRSRVYQWFGLARVLDQDTRDIISKYTDFNQAWIFDNKFLVGEGVDEKIRLKATSFELAVALAL